MMFKVLRVTMWILMVCACTQAALAQTVTGSVTGIVTDPSGAIVRDAQVTATNVDTNVQTSQKTNGEGVYNILFLPIGRYTVTVTEAGFTDTTTAPFALEIRQTVKLNLQLAVSANNTVVNVQESAAPALDTTDATLGFVFTSNTIENLPLNGLDFSALTLYLPGSVNTAGTSGMQSIERSTYYTDTPNVNGNRAQSNNYTLDGIDLNETFNNLIAYSPAPASLGEVKVISANASADYGNVNGGGIVSVLKSGTNVFHGSLYGYYQNQNFNANTWQHKNVLPIAPKNNFSQSQFGATFGGPLIRNKLFFFVDYLGARYHTGGTDFASVLTAAMRQGDFSALTGQGIQLYDSQNNFTPYAGNRGLVVSNSVATYLFAHPEFYPLPNATATDGLIANNYHGSFRSFKANNQGDVKLEYTPTARDRFSGFFSISNAYDGSTAVLNIQFPSQNVFPTKVFGTNWVHTFSPNIVNSARAGFTRVVWKYGIPSDPLGAFGLTGDTTVGIPLTGQQYVGFSSQNISGASGLGTPGYNFGFTDNTFSYIDNLTIQRGKNLFSVGVQALRYQNNYPTSNNFGFLGQFTYGGKYTSNPNNTSGNASGYGPADFILNRIQEASVTLGSINVGQRQWRASGYFQDDYKVTPSFTVNVGIRYELDQPWIESNNKTGNVDLTTGQPIYAGSVPVGAAAGSGVCSNRGCYQTNYKQVMPRLGFAYQATNRFVIRGGYGATSFYESNSSNQRLTAAPPFIQAVDIKALTPTDTPTATAPAGGAPRRIQDGFNYTDPNDLSRSGTYSTYPQNIQPAYIQEFNLTTEYALTPTVTLQVGYLGETGQHIEDYGNANQYRVVGDPTSAPFYKNPNFGTNPLLVTESRAMMNYNALQSVLRYRQHNGLEFTANYTYAKAMTNSLGNYALGVSGFSGAFQNYYDSAADYGPAGYDVKHNFSTTAVYAVPVGHGKKFASNVNAFLDEVIGGWKLSLAGVVYSGFPETPTGGSATGNSSSFGTSRPNQYRQLKIVNRSVNQWFGTDPSAKPCLTPGVDDGVCAFGLPSTNSYGTARNGSLRGPGYRNFDLAAFKEFRLFREHYLGFHFDAFNAFNNVSYGNPDTGIANTSFGQIAQQNQIRSQERRLQFSAKYLF
jgi:hypothetical protein